MGRGPAPIALSVIALQASGVGVSAMIAYVAESVGDPSKYGLAYSIYRAFLIASSLTLSALFVALGEGALALVALLSLTGFGLRFPLKEFIKPSHRLTIRQLAPDLRELRDKPALLYSLILAPTTYLLYSLSPYYRSVYGVGMEVIAGFYAALSAIPMLTAPLGGALIDRFGHIKLLIASSATYSVLMAIFALPMGVIQSFTVALLGALTFDVLQAALNVYLAAVTTEGERGRVNSIRLFYWLLLSVPAPYLAGAILSLNPKLLTIPIVLAAALYSAALRRTLRT